MPKPALLKALRKLGLSPRVSAALAYSPRGEAALKQTKDITKAAKIALAAMRNESVIGRMYDLLESLR